MEFVLPVCDKLWTIYCIDMMRRKPSCYLFGVFLNVGGHYIMDKISTIPLPSIYCPCNLCML